MTPNLFICMALVAVGILFHFVLKLSELETQGKLQTPLGYWREHPYTSLVVVMAAYLFMALQAALGELTGIACNSLGDKLRARAQALK
jgi:hypothetical protein